VSVQTRVDRHINVRNVLTHNRADGHLSMRKVLSHKRAVRRINGRSVNSCTVRIDTHTRAQSFDS